MAGSGTGIGLPVTGREEAWVAAGVSTPPEVQPTVTLLPLLHQLVTAETRAPIVLLLPGYETRLGTVPEDGVQLLVHVLQTAGGKPEIVLTTSTA